MSEETSIYQFPRVYLEGAESRERATVRGGRLVVGAEGEYGLVTYEKALEEILPDLSQPVVARSFIVLVPWRREALLVEKGTRVTLVEARGTHVTHTAREGDRVDEGTVLAYVLTGKGETRTVRARSRGVIAYVGWLGDSPQTHVYVIVPEDSVTRLEVEGESG
ncbi:MAG: DUF2118 domain-containing protein [Desulfurococcales archaeon]|nr:DUF2118 domain-containing protein [Desulfurococcales archaeon]